MATTSINGTTIHYDDRGRGKVLLLLHGFPLDMRVWEEQATALSDSYRVIRVDLRGFGQSVSDKPFSIQDLADDVHALVKQLNICPFVLGGLSMGGYVALAFVKKYPMDLAGLILTDTRANGDDAHGKEARDRMADLALKSGSVAVADQMESKMISRATREHRPQIHQALRQIMESCPAHTIANASLAMRDREDFQDELPSIACPTLIVCGAEDALTGPELAHRMQNVISGSQLEVIPGAGHMAPMEQPSAVTTVIRQFLQKVYGA